MAITPESSAAGYFNGYFNLWNKAKIKPEREAAAKAIAKKAIGYKERYQRVQQRTNDAGGGVPWFFTAVVHQRESSMNFNGVLHNGEHILGTGRKTKLVPKGRGPFPAAAQGGWEIAADDALRLKGLNKITRWSVERTLFEIERYNGWGYLGKINSPYVWAWTNLQQPGKYIADHVWSSTAVDTQPGCAAILLELQELDSDVRQALGDRQPVAPQEVLDEAKKEATKKDVRNVVVGTGATAAGAGTKVSTQKPINPTLDFGHTYILPLVIAIGMAVIVVAAIQIVRKRNKIQSSW